VNPTENQRSLKAHERDFYAVEADEKKRHDFEVMLSGIAIHFVETAAGLLLLSAPLHSFVFETEPRKELKR
jgi:hypothetical protein